MMDNIWNEEMLDKLHFSWDKTFGYQKTWNAVIGSRASGKSVDSWIKLYNAFFYQNRPSIVFRRRTVDITSAYLDDLTNLFNKFLKPEYRIQLCYLSGDVKSGCADVHVGKAGCQYNWQQIKKLPVFFRIVALSCPMSRLKSLMMPNIAYFFFDEFIANTRAGEKYLSDEKFLISELYTTFVRESPKGIKIIMAGNPYSVYCSIFSGLNVDSSKLKPGSFVVGPDYVIDCFKVGPELAEQIRRSNPMFIADEEYTRYAFGGESINDANIRLCKREPRGFKLKWVFKLGSDFISVHSGNYTDKEGKARFWICKHKSDWLSKVSKRRKIIVFDFADLIKGAVKWSIEDRLDLSMIKDAMNKREIIYNSVDASYMTEDISVYF